MSRAFAGLGLDPWVAGNTHLLGGYGLAEDAVQFFGQHFVTGLAAILLFDDAERHLARAEAGHLDVLSHTLQALIHLLFDILDGDGQVDAAFQFVGLSGGRFHEGSL